MTHPLEHQLARLRRRLRRWLVVYGLGRLVVTIVGAAVAMGLADYVFRFRDPGIRIMLTSALVGATGWACYRWLYRPWTVRLGRMELARRVGRRFPELGDDLASAVEFLTQPADDPAAGSADLRHEVVAQTTVRSQRLDFSAMVNPRPTLRGSLVALGVCLVAGILFVLDPVSSQIALARLAAPLGGDTWPRKNYLQLRECVQRVARGEAFEVEVVDRYGATLPSRVEVHYRLEAPDGRTTDEMQPMRLVGNMMVARRENVTGSFAYRVEGGDDRSMGWIDVEVVEPPAIRSLSVTVTPPAYTGLPPSQANGPWRVRRGSRLAIEGIATKPLRSAEFWLENAEPRTCLIARDGRHFTLGDGQSVVPDRSGLCGFDLVDREGIRGGQRDHFEIQIEEDQPPSVRSEQPLGTVFVTPEATLPVRVVARDDLALARIELAVEPNVGIGAPRFDDAVTAPDATGKPRRQDVRAPRAITLFEGPPRAAPSDAGGHRETVEYRWSLADLGLRPGVTLAFRAIASDYSPQTSQSDSQRIVVVRPEQWIDRMGDTQQSILADLARSLALAERSRRQVEQTHDAQSARHLEQKDIDRLRAAELGQREASRILAAGAEGVPERVRGLLAELRNNRLDDTDVERRMESILAELDRLGRTVLPNVAQELTDTIKTAEAALESQAARPSPPEQNEPGSSLASALARVRKGQDAVISSLQSLLARLTQWNDYRRFHRQWAELVTRQETLAERTEAFGRDALGRAAEDVAPEAATRLKTLADEESELARQLDQLLQEMDQAGPSLAAQDATAATTVAGAVSRSRQLGTSARMQSAADAVAANRLAHARVAEAEILVDLRQVLDLLGSRRQPNMGRIESTVVSLERRQRLLAEQTRLLDTQSPAPRATPRTRRAALRRLTLDQGALERETSDLVAAVGGVVPVRQGLEEAAGHMAIAAGWLGRQNTDRRTQTAQAAAADRLARLVQTLRETRSADAGKPDEHRQGPLPAGGTTPGDVGQPAATGGTQPGDAGKAAGVGGGPAGDVRRVDPRQVRDMMKQLWGELPPRERERLLAMPDEEFLPGYETLIEQYFRRLSQEKRKEETR